MEVHFDMKAHIVRLCKDWSGGECIAPHNLEGRKEQIKIVFKVKASTCVPCVSKASPSMKSRQTSGGEGYIRISIREVSIRMRTPFGLIP